MGVMSPSAPALETAGMEEANQYFRQRPWMKPGLCKMMGEGYFQRMCTLGQGGKADGFRRWAYLVAQERAAEVAEVVALGKPGDKYDIYDI